MKRKTKQILEYIAVFAVLLAILFATFVAGAAVGYTDCRKEIEGQRTAQKPSEVHTAQTAQAVTECQQLDFKSEEKKIVRIEPVLISAVVDEQVDAVVESAGESVDETVDLETHAYTDDDVYCLAAVIYQEAGSDSCSDETRYMVADVVLNRVADNRFPDSVRDVLEDAPGGCLQYGRFAITGVCFPARAELESEKHAVQRAWYIAREIAAGEHSDLYGNGYIWQAEFGQGTDQIWADGICFGR